MPDTISQMPPAQAVQPTRRRWLWFSVLGLAIIGGLLGIGFIVASGPAAAPLPATAPPDPVALRVAAVSDHLTGIDKTLAGLVDALRRIELHVQAIEDKLDRPAPVAAAPVAVVRPRRVVRKPEPVALPTVPVDNTQLLSVDTWDNRPSIALRGADGAVHFAQDGETTAQGRYSVGHGGAQSVRIDRSDGSTAVLHAVEDR